MLVLDTYDFDSKEIASATVEKLIKTANLSEAEQEILYLLYTEEWSHAEIARHIGEKYEGRSRENPLTEGTIRYRLKGILERLRQAHASLTKAVV